MTHSGSSLTDVYADSPVLVLACCPYAELRRSSIVSSTMSIATAAGLLCVLVAYTKTTFCPCHANPPSPDPKKHGDYCKFGTGHAGDHYPFPGTCFSKDHDNSTELKCSCLNCGLTDPAVCGNHTSPTPSPTTPSPTPPSPTPSPTPTPTKPPTSQPTPNGTAPAGLTSAPTLAPGTGLHGAWLLALIAAILAGQACLCFGGAWVLKRTFCQSCWRIEQHQAGTESLLPGAR